MSNQLQPQFQPKLPVGICGLLITALLVLPGCHFNRDGDRDRRSSARKTESWETHVNTFLEDYFNRHPDFAVRAGRHEFDGKLPDWSPEGLRKTIESLREEQDTLKKYRDRDLEHEQEFERDYLEAVVGGELFWLETAEWPQRNPFYYLKALDPDVYVSRTYAPLDQRLRAYTDYAKGIPVAVQQIRNNLQTPLPKTYVAISSTSFSGLVSFYEKDVPAIFGAVKDEQLQRNLAEANGSAIKAMKELITWFQTQEATATDNFALGAEKFTAMLRATEGVEVRLDELEGVGKRDLARNQAALREACAKFAPGQTPVDCVHKALANKPAGGAVEVARHQLVELKAFINEKKIVTIPGTEEALVAESPAYRRWNFAYINIPGPYEKNLPSTYYITPPDPSWTAAERDAYVPGRASLLFTSVHEVWPGHFLQFLHANRAPSKLGQVFIGYAFAEGWAHYAEEMMWDAGLGNDDPETHIGQLLNAMLRDVRFLSAIGMHTGRMTVAESERMFREDGFQDPGTARQQAARGTFDPAYLNYTMGKLMIRKLREDWTKTRGGKDGWQKFHDEFLKYGGPPIPLVRKAMMAEEDKGSLF
jgi:uncharacterized protein (DUF885 family)